MLCGSKQHINCICYVFNSDPVTPVYDRDYYRLKLNLFLLGTTVIFKLKDYLSFNDYFMTWTIKATINPIFVRLILFE